MLSRFKGLKTAQSIAGLADTAFDKTAKAATSLGDGMHRGLRSVSKPRVHMGDTVKAPEGVVFENVTQARSSVLGTFGGKLVDVASQFESTMRVVRVFERVNPRDLPALLDDQSENLHLIRTILDYLDSHMGAESHFEEEVTNVVSMCFKHGVHPERVKRFLKSDLLLQIVIEESLRHNFGVSRFRAANLVSGLQSAANSVGVKSKLAKKTPVFWGSF